ncbi:HAMP domain-containing protein [Actinotalea sp. BY-33]|uniref:histidine kinase n=1 Tax=Actinotalea soli TaxID=2819234 RepID=A0A939LPY7_9CELL|nr:ATP-binding protein [Actinotalea soli]MBO1751828.1 HAMP domain-containing protein [Actinotalea soli]
MDRWSLRVRLTVLTAASLCVTLVIGAVALTTVLSSSRVAALDEIARERVAVVEDLVLTDQLPATLPVSEPGELVQLVDAAGQVVASSPNASRTLPVLPAEDLAELSGPQVTVLTTTASAYDGETRAAVLGTTYRGEPVTIVATVPLAEVQGLVDALRLALVGVVPVLTALLALAIWLVLGRALHPVDQLRRAAAQVARSGGPGALPVPRTDDELAALARTLNEMLDRLEVAAARQRAFVADAAHELRSPLAALRASIEVARAHPETYPAGALAQDLEEEVLRMQALVDDLLLLARMGSHPRPRTTLDLRAAVEEVVGGLVAGGGLVVVRAEGQGEAQGEHAAVVRVVRNLVENAARHARTTVQVAVAEGEVTVEDDGNGIPAEDRERVFARFVRLDEAREREAGGSGLGLAIAREIAREHGGDVTLDEGRLGGLLARVRLPRSSEAAPGEVAGAVGQDSPATGAETKTQKG